MVELSLGTLEGGITRIARLNEQLVWGPRVTDQQVCVLTIIYANICRTLVYIILDVRILLIIFLQILKQLDYWQDQVVVQIVEV